MRRRFFEKLLSVVIFILFLYSSGWAGLDCSFLNVGEGESVLLESAGEAALVDTGNVMTGKDAVRKLKQIGVKELKYLIITHPHPDHMGGIFRVLESFSAEKIYDNGEKIGKNPTCDLYRWYSEFIRKRDHYRSLNKGDHLKLGDARLEVLWPDEGFEGNWNENSLVIMVRGGGKKILLMGDVPARVEGLLVKEHGGALRADVLKVGHHGAADATSPDFLEAVRPKWAVICTNKDNIRGYPSKKVIKRLKNRGVKIYKTFEDGDIRFSGNKKLRILTSQ